MTDDEREIRELLERWATAVHAGDLDGVLADHAADIVMFDVPPPVDGVRGIDAYRDIWPDFFVWQRQGARFTVTSMEVTAGADVAFAHALLLCGKPEELARDPGNRLRLTSASARRTAGGSSPTSTTPSRTAARTRPRPSGRCGAALGVSSGVRRPGRPTRSRWGVVAMGFADRFSHKAQELRGRVKRNAGEVTGDRRLEAEGRSEEVRGSLKQAGEKIKDVFRPRGPRRPRY